MTRENLMKKTVKELREMAKESGVKGYSKLSKSELVACLDVATDVKNITENKETEEVQEMEVKIENENSGEECNPVNRDEAKELKVVKKMWNGKEKIRYICPVCGVRIYNPDTDHFCFNCGQKLKNIKAE